MEFVPTVSFSTKNTLLELSPTIEIVPDKGVVKACLLVDKKDNTGPLKLVTNVEITQTEDDKSTLEFIKEYIEGQAGVKKPQNVITDTGASYEKRIRQHAEAILKMTKRNIATNSEYSGFYILTKLVKNNKHSFEIQSEFTNPREGLENILSNLEQVKIMKKERALHRERVESSLLLILPASSKEVVDI